ncbi:hypothetical protein [Agromyces seonyuensis]|uniref:ABC transporter ATP-binding protein n=1 Tax=Agromyces seonyuensis TaxID=2662446 RepID=A0A6I4NZC1_9MICO|nr:hypothetical protein [Agromyces seonyuensis]MWB99666.1 hypothetical protein [Agromyces seonyuensis]
MSNTPGDEFPAPTRRELLKPLEYLGGAGIAGIFTGVIVLMVTRDWALAGIFAAAAFIVVLVVLALTVLSFKPDEREIADLAEQGSTEEPPAADPREGLH